MGGADLNFSLVKKFPFDFDCVLFVEDLLHDAWILIKIQIKLIKGVWYHFMVGEDIPVVLETAFILVHILICVKRIMYKNWNILDYVKHLVKFSSV